MYEGLRRYWGIGARRYVIVGYFMRNVIGGTGIVYGDIPLVAARL
jgi:hypothetical protein